MEVVLILGYGRLVVSPVCFEQLVGPAFLSALRASMPAPPQNLSGLGTSASGYFLRIFGGFRPA